MPHRVEHIRRPHSAPCCSDLRCKVASLLLEHSLLLSFTVSQYFNQLVGLLGMQFLTLLYLRKAPEGSCGGG